MVRCFHGVCGFSSDLNLWNPSWRFRFLSHGVKALGSLSLLLQLSLESDVRSVSCSSLWLLVSFSRS